MPRQRQCQNIGTEMLIVLEDIILYVEYFTVGRLRYEPPIGYSNISLSLYLEAELIAGSGLKTYQFLRGKQSLIFSKALV